MLFAIEISRHAENVDTNDKDIEWLNPKLGLLMPRDKWITWLRAKRNSKGFAEIHVATYTKHLIKISTQYLVGFTAVTFSSLDFSEK